MRKSRKGRVECAGRDPQRSGDDSSGCESKPNELGRDAEILHIMRRLEWTLFLLVNQDPSFTDPKVNEIRNNIRSAKEELTNLGR